MTVEAKVPTGPIRVAAPAAKDRRADPRYKFVAAAEAVEDGSGKRVESRVSDLSRQGCYFETRKPFSLGTVATVRITKGSETFEAKARVVSSSEGKGMGILFTAIVPADGPILAAWLASSLESSWLTSSRRRSQRIVLRCKIGVSGESNSGIDFIEAAYTQVVTAHGALILLAASVHKGQHLTISNGTKKTVAECVVAHIGGIQDNLVEVGLAFILPNPGFWGAAFPPEDWSVRHPDAKSNTTVG